MTKFPRLGNLIKITCEMNDTVSRCHCLPLCRDGPSLSMATMLRDRIVYHYGYLLVAKSGLLQHLPCNTQAFLFMIRILPLHYCVGHIVQKSSSLCKLRTSSVHFGYLPCFIANKNDMLIIDPVSPVSTARKFLGI